MHIISGFEAKGGFPGVLGAIDGSHIVCKGLQGKNAQSYINRHGLPSVLLQAICDHEARFLHCSAGDPGSVHDARMYRRSELPTILTADKFPFDSHLFGDGAYPLRQSLLVPYRNNGRLTEQHRKYNTTHSQGAVPTTPRHDDCGSLRNAQRVRGVVGHLRRSPTHKGTDSDSSESGASSSEEDDAPTVSRDKARGKAKRDFIMHSL
ncbi:hypothetical protein HPB47_026798 [Ixodes persulcatus]|uniref:Uncharacterized protein n=1 Tax=Ixodes persulcatus TaxID=34615 RepID=A0AC60PZM8_IXOPE|nr:hypothetical protein HPB47_026798 [Ixodes persulcatus]